MYKLYIHAGDMDAAVTEITTLDALLDRLGGKEQAMSILSATKGQVSIWKHRKHIPARLYDLHQQVLSGLCIKASPTIWSMEVRS